MPSPHTTPPLLLELIIPLELLLPLLLELIIPLELLLLLMPPPPPLLLLLMLPPAPLLLLLPLVALLVPLPEVDDGPSLDELAAPPAPPPPVVPPPQAAHTMPMIDAEIPNFVRRMMVMRAIYFFCIGKKANCESGRC